MKNNLLHVLVGAMLLLSACTNKQSSNALVQQMNATSSMSTGDLPKNISAEMIQAKAEGLEVATLAGGCFWKMDAAFQQLKGVKKVVVGFAGGRLENPSYEAVSGEQTGHAETFQVVYDPKVVSYKELLHYFWFMHDPTKPNQEGNDIGPSYRSIVFYHNEAQKADAEAVKAAAATMFDSPILTEIAPYSNFYRAEEYHQNYFNQHQNESYCAFVVAPKVHKFEAAFQDKLKAPKL